MRFKKGLVVLLLLAGLVFVRPQAFGFALLGPVAPWMQASNGVVLPGDIGGPMQLGAEYRWNVPVVTYGFDQTFLDYFGTNGVKAVEAAFQILNGLPRASDMVLANYPLDSREVNQVAESQSLVDLKSATLQVLLEEMGLGKPVRSMFVIKKSTPGLSLFWDEFFHGFIEMGMEWATSTNNPLHDNLQFRNYDPQSLLPSNLANGVMYFFQILLYPDKTYVMDYPVDPLADYSLAVADGTFPGAGEFYSSLTRDDVGGLKYLLASTNINYERLLHGVFIGRPMKRDSGAWRPGVEKISFVAQPVSLKSGHFKFAYFEYSDRYYAGGRFRSQRAVRLVWQPDILFCAADNEAGTTNMSYDVIARTDTSKWVNNAVANANPTGEGPGVIAPRIQIRFHRLGGSVLTHKPWYAGGAYEANYNTLNWGAFDASASFPIMFPASSTTAIRPLVVHLRHYTDNTAQTLVTNQTWHLNVALGGLAALQVSSDAVNWTSLAVVTNRGGVIDWWHYETNSPVKIFRVVSE